MNTIYKYNKPKSGSSAISGGGGGYVATSVVTDGVADAAKRLLETRKIFGQPFNGTQDVAGDITNARNITANGGDISVESILEGNNEIGGNIYADGNVVGIKFIGDVDANNVTAENITATNGTITALSGTTLQYDDATLQEAIIDALNSTEITTEKLTVTKQAHFFELIIDKIKAAGGAVLITPADGFRVELVKTVNPNPAFYRLYWKATDGEKSISNKWRAGDQAICQTFNKAGNGYSVANKFYWSVVVESGRESIEGQDYNFICITGSNTYNSKSDYNGIVAPEVGDEIAMLGYRGNDDESRRSAIYIAAYNSIDPSLTAPLICHYKGVNNFNLPSHKYTWFAANGNEIRGKLKIESGQTIQDYVENNLPSAGESAYLHIAYSNSADGSVDFTKSNDSGDYLYIGLCSNFKLSDDDLTYSNYTWSRLKGDTGQSGQDLSYYKLVPITEQAQVQGTGDLLVMLKYYVVHIEGNKSTMVAINSTGYSIRFKGDAQNYYTYLSNSTMPAYTNAHFQKDYLGAGNDATEYLTVQLVNGTNILDTRIVTVIVNTSAILQITDSITARVSSNEQSIQDNANAIDGLSEDVATNTNNIAQLQIKADSISSTVQQHTTSINTLNGQVAGNTTNISNLTQTANGLQSTVESHTETLGEHTTKISQIEQTAEDIRLQVDEVSLRIDGKKIMLDGDTEINGDLTMDNSTQGLILIGDGGTTQIKPTTIGTFSQFSSKSYQTIVKTGEDVALVSPQTGLGVVEMEHQIGYLQSGVFIEMRQLSFSSKRGNKSANAVNVSFEIYKDGVKCNNAQANVNYQMQYNFLTYTTTAGGVYTVRIKIISTFDTSDEYSTQTVNSKIGYSVLLPTDALTILGYDGYASNFGNNKTVYFGGEQSIISYGDAKLRFTTNGIEKYAGTTGSKRMNNGIYTDTAYSEYVADWVSLNGKVVRKVTTAGEVYLQQNDEIIVVTATSGTVNINLLNAKNFDSVGVYNKNMVGRQVYIKRIGNCTVSIKGYSGTAKNLVTPDSSNLVESYNPNGRSMMVMSDGERWILYYCG